MNSGGSLKGLGVLLLAAAMGLVIYQGKQTDKSTSTPFTETPSPSNWRSRDRVQGTPAERLERMRGVLVGKKRNELKAEDFRLMKSLSSEALMDLTDEFAADNDGDPERPWPMILEMLKRLGEMKRSAALDWVINQSECDRLTGISKSMLVQGLLLGWADRDPLAALATVLYPDTPSYSKGGYEYLMAIDTQRPELVAKATTDDPEGTWRLLCRNRMNELSVQFFAALDPAGAKGYAMRLPELFRDPDQPGLEMFGGLETDLTTTSSTDRYQSAAKAAAGGWLIKEPEAALAWYLEQSPVVDESEEEFGKKAGDLIGTWVKLEPDNAMDWARSKPPGMRGGMADELASMITSGRTYSEEDMSRLNEAFEWMDGNRRIQWLAKTAESQRWHAADRDVSSSPAGQILAGLRMTPQEKASLEEVLAQQSGQ